MQFSIYTLEKSLFEGEIKSATLPTKAGEITVLDGHIPLISALKQGEVKIIGKDESITRVEINGGFLEVRPPAGQKTEAVVLAEGKISETISGIEAQWLER
jgi:F-type H+-transporting ATPase subunit epsilon